MSEATTENPDTVNDCSIKKNQGVMEILTQGMSYFSDSVTMDDFSTNLGVKIPGFLETLEAVPEILRNNTVGEVLQRSIFSPTRQTGNFVPSTTPDDPKKELCIEKQHL